LQVPASALEKFFLSEPHGFLLHVAAIVSLIMILSNFRCSAVFGGIYCLKRQTHSLALDAEGRAIGIYSKDQLLKSPFVVLEESLNPKSVIKSGISRAILVTDK